MALDVEAHKHRSGVIDSPTIEERPFIIVPDELHGDRLRHIYIEGRLSSSATTSIEECVQGHYVGMGSKALEGWSMFVQRGHDRKPQVHRPVDEVYAHLLLNQPTRQDNIALRMHPESLADPSMKDFKCYLARQAMANHH